MELHRRLLFRNSCCGEQATGCESLGRSNRWQLRCCSKELEQQHSHRPVLECSREPVLGCSMEPERECSKKGVGSMNCDEQSRELDSCVRMGHS